MNYKSFSLPLPFSLPLTAAMGSGSEGGHTQPVIHVETSGATHDHSTIANDWHGKICHLYVYVHSLL